MKLVPADQSQYKMHRRNYTQYSHRSLQQTRYNSSISAQLRSSWPSIFIGCAMFVAGMSLLFWNECRAIHTTRSLEEAMNTVIAVQFTAQPKKENNRRLVHLTGPLSVSEPLAEMEYGIAIPAVRLKRRVQMYQWVEDVHTREFEQEESALSSYSYTTEWKDRLIDSNRFYQKVGHHNPKVFPLKSAMYVCEEVNIGFYILGKELKEKFSNFILVTSDERPERRDIKMHSGLYYHSQDVWNPEVGDVRVQFSYAGKAGEVVTVVGMQVGHIIKPYKTTEGKEVLILYEGVKTVGEIFTQEHSQNLWLMWTFRLMGWIFMYQGASCFSHVLYLICQGILQKWSGKSGKNIPKTYRNPELAVTSMQHNLKSFQRRYGTIVWSSVGRYSMLHEVMVVGFGSISVAVSFSCALLICALAWICYRPFFGLCVVCATVMPFVYASIKLYIQDYYDNNYRRLHTH